MNFECKPLNDHRLAPNSATIRVGRFVVGIDYNPYMLGGIKWQIMNEDAVRPEDNFPLSGKIDTSETHVHACVMLLLSELGRYEKHLLTQEAIEADPARYEAIAKKQIEAEEKAAQKAAEEQAAAERSAQRAADAEAKKLEAKAKADAKAAEEAAKAEEVARRKLVLEQRIRDAAARELGVAG